MNLEAELREQIAHELKAQIGYGIKPDKLMLMKHLKKLSLFREVSFGQDFYDRFWGRVNLIEEGCKFEFSDEVASADGIQEALRWLLHLERVRQNQNLADFRRMRAMTAIGIAGMDVRKWKNDGPELEFMRFLATVLASSKPQTVESFAARRPSLKLEPKSNSATTVSLDVDYHFSDRVLVRVEVRRRILPKFDGTLVFRECQDFFMWSIWGRPNSSKKFTIHSRMDEVKASLVYSPRATFTPLNQAPYVLDVEFSGLRQDEEFEYIYSVSGERTNLFREPRYEHVFVAVQDREAEAKSASIGLYFVNGRPLSHSVGVYQNSSIIERRPGYDMLSVPPRTDGSYFVQFDKGARRPFSLFSGFAWAWDKKR